MYVAVVAVLWHLGVAAQRLQVAGLHRRAEPVHLAAGVVEVVLALDRPARGRQAAAPARRRCGVARVPERQRSGGVRADELDLHPPAVGRRRP